MSTFDLIKLKQDLLTLSEHGNKFLVLESKEISPLDIKVVEKPVYKRTTKSWWNNGPVITKTISSNYHDQYITKYIASQIRVGNDCRNIAKFIGIALPTPDSRAVIFPEVVLEYYSNGTLHEYLASSPLMPMNERLNITDDILRGLIYIHERGVYHHALDDQHVYINEYRRAVIADFGVPLTESEYHNNHHGSSQIHSIFIPPEHLEIISQKQQQQQEKRETKRRKHEITFIQTKPNVQYNNKSDMYSFGVLFWEIMTGTLSHDSKYLFKPSIKNEHYELLRQMCCHRDPYKRPTASKMLKNLNLRRSKDNTYMVDVGMFISSPNLYVHNILSNTICRIKSSRIETVSTTNTESGDNIQTEWIKMTCTLDDNKGEEKSRYLKGYHEQEFYITMSCSVNNYKNYNDILQLSGGVFLIKNLYIQPSPDGQKVKPVLEITDYTKITLLDYSRQKSTHRQREHLERIPNVIKNTDVDDHQDDQSSTQTSMTIETVYEERVNTKRKIDDVVDEVCHKTKKCLERIRNNKDPDFIIEICADAIRDISNDIYGFGLMQTHPHKKRKLCSKFKE